MELNQTPIRTSKNYNINSIIVKKNANFAKKIENMPINSLNFKNYSINNKNSITISNIKFTPISNHFNQELCDEINNKSNLNLSFNFIKNSTEPIIININFDNNNDILISRLNFNIDSGVSSNIILKFNSQLCKSYNNSLLTINLKNESNANIIIFNDNNNSSETYFSIQSNIEKNAKLQLNIIDFASNNSIFNYNSKNLGENSTSNLNSLYMGDLNSTIDMNYYFEIFAPNSKTNIEVIGAISDSARKHFKGTIDFKKGCKKSIGSENEFCMLLSKDAKSKALPMILCSEEDVDGKHSSAVGKVDEKQLFYIMSRGFNYSQAVNILIKAKFNSIINTLFDEKIKVEILNRIDGKTK